MVLGPGTRDNWTRAAVRDGEDNKRLAVGELHPMLIALMRKMAHRFAQSHLKGNDYQHYANGCITEWVKNAKVYLDIRANFKH
jgi:hypothetical protein